MADDKTDDQAKADQAKADQSKTDDQAKASDPTPAQRGQAAATAAAEAEKRQADETVPGGRYIVAGQVVNADGEPVKDAKD